MSPPHPVKPRMHRFKTALAPGTRTPYRTWTFIVLPSSVTVDWPPGQKAVRGTVSGHPFQGTASRGEGTWRVPVTREFRERAGLGPRDVVEVALELDAAPQEVAIPPELQAVFEAHPGVRADYDRLPPSMQRAWATHVAEARQAATRVRRAEAARAGIRRRSYPGRP